MNLGEQFGRALAGEIVRLQYYVESQLTWSEWLDTILKDLHGMAFHPSTIPGPFIIPKHLESALDGTDTANIAAWSKLTGDLLKEDLMLRRDQLPIGHPSIGRTRPAYVLVYVGSQMDQFVTERDSFRTNVRNWKR